MEVGVSCVHASYDSVTSGDSCKSETREVMDRCKTADLCMSYTADLCMSYTYLQVTTPIHARQDTDTTPDSVEHAMQAAPAASLAPPLPSPHPPPPADPVEEEQN